MPIVNSAIKFLHIARLTLSSPPYYLLLQIPIGVDRRGGLGIIIFSTPSPLAWWPVGPMRAVLDP